MDDLPGKFSLRLNHFKQLRQIVIVRVYSDDSCIAEAFTFTPRPTVSIII